MRGATSAPTQCLFREWQYYLRGKAGYGDLENVQTWDNGKFDEIDLDKWVRSSPNYLLTNKFAGVPASTISKMRET